MFKSRTLSGVDHRVFNSKLIEKERNKHRRNSEFYLGSTQGGNRTIFPPQSATLTTKIADSLRHSRSRLLQALLSIKIPVWGPWLQLLYNKKWALSGLLDDRDQGSRFLVFRLSLLGGYQLEQEPWNGFMYLEHNPWTTHFSLFPHMYVLEQTRENSSKARFLVDNEIRQKTHSKSIWPNKQNVHFQTPAQAKIFTPKLTALCVGQCALLQHVSNELLYAWKRKMFFACWPTHHAASLDVKGSLENHQIFSAARNVGLKAWC